MFTHYLVLMAFLSSPADSGASEASYCQSIRDSEQHLDERLDIVGTAEAGAHPFEITVSPEGCGSKMSMVLSPGLSGRENKDFLRLRNVLYPGYPDPDAAVEAKATIHLSGKLQVRKNHGLLMRYIDVEELDIR